MNLKELGIDPMRGGCVILCSGQVVKNEPWSFTDEKTAEYREGYSLSVAYFGGTIKVQTAEGDPLRKIPVGSVVDLSIPCADAGPGKGLKQNMAATLVSSKPIAEGKAA